MSEFNSKLHWDTIYKTKQLSEVSWYQPTPFTSLDFIQASKLPKTAEIIDIGGGDSFLVDHLLKLGYNNITVLDISELAIERAKKRLGLKASKITWIIEDIKHFKANNQYDIWHDRAAFHFLTENEDIAVYYQKTVQYLSKNGQLVISTFSDQGPNKCSGIETSQYTEEKLTKLFSPSFRLINSININHSTPFDTKQNFVFCHFEKHNKAS